jgi:hypothetical protein
MNRFLLLLSVVVFGNLAQAQQNSLQVLVNVKNLVTTYSGDGQDYSATQVAAITTIKVSVGGFSTSLGGPSDQGALAGIPDTEAGEYNKLNFQKEPGKLGMLRFNILSKYATAGPVKNDYNTEIELVEGTWGEFDAGQTVKARLSKIGIDQSREAFKITVGAFANMMTSISPSAQITVESSEDDIITMSKTQIIIPFAFVHAKVDMPLGTN